MQKIGKTMLLMLFVLFLTTHAVAANSLMVSPEMELMAGVLSQTSWIEQHGPMGSGNEYFRALQEFVADYQDHQAVSLAEQFTKKGFTYDAPPAFICHLGPLPDLELAYEYSDYLLGRAGGRERLEEFRMALIDLAAEADFLSFYAAWEPYLEDNLAPYLEKFRLELVEGWLSDFFGWSPAGFRLIMTPSMFPGGGYGASVTDSAGDSVAFQIIRENGSSEGPPEFPAGVSLENLAVHELGHAFVNPSLEAYPKRTNQLRALFWPVRKTMAEQAYGSMSTFLNEQVIRAMEVLAARELFSAEIGGIVLENHESRGFYLTRYVVEQLEYYQVNRDLYPTFREFVPYLFDQLELYQKKNSTWQARFFGRFLR
ncbi:MAG: DUF4932 domain-containing protein [Limnochordia bacterium]|jgi:hypothetical protein|nr:DUF4932 domain-containing protein [Limnochordia bacterium]